MRVMLERTVSTAVEPTENVLRIAGMFGLGIDEQRTMRLVPPTAIDLHAGQLIFITGASGSGKSTLLHLIAHALKGCDDARVLRFDALPPLPDLPLIDALSVSASLTPEQAMRLFSLSGLNDAFVMLRKPGELSDGQRYRLRLAQTMALALKNDTEQLCVVLADEFGATLDRITAQVIARNVRKWSRWEANICFVAATTHDDLLEALEPDVLIEKHLSEGIEVLSREGR